ncbi:hypothetical protein GQ457_03G011680 [Hibiscus cannabinus]
MMRVGRESGWRLWEIGKGEVKKFQFVPKQRERLLFSASKQSNFFKFMLHFRFVRLEKIPDFSGLSS